MEDIIVLSHHRKKTMKRCKFKAYLHYELRKQKVENNIELIFGTAIHSTLEVYYAHKRKISINELIETFVESMQLETDNQLLLLDLNVWTKIGINIVTKYYNATKDKEKFNILLTEHPFLLSISDEGNILKDSSSMSDIHKDAFFILAGKIDLTIGSDNDIFFVDHKTTTMNQERFKDHYRLDEQLLDYSIFGRWMYGDNFKGVMINGINKKINSNEPLIFRDWFSYTDDEINLALLSYLDTAQEYYILRQEPHLLEQRSQDFDCTRCEYLDVSIAKRRGENWKEILDLYYNNIEEFDWEK